MSRLPDPETGATERTRCPVTRLGSRGRLELHKRLGMLSALGLILALPLAGCNTSGSSNSFGVTASPKLVPFGKPVPSGGGYFKIGNPYKVAGRWYHPKEDPGYDEVGLASWYGSDFHGRKTANGEIFDMTALTAAHPTLPLPTYAKVTNLENGRSVVVRVNDRGPFAHGRLIDLSKRTADILDFRSSGTAQVRVQYVGLAPIEGNDGQWLTTTVRESGQPVGPVMMAVPAEQQKPAQSSQQTASARSLSTGAPEAASLMGYSQTPAAPASGEIAAATGPTPQVPVSESNVTYKWVTGFAVGADADTAVAAAFALFDGRHDTGVSASASAQFAAATRPLR